MQVGTFGHLQAQVVAARVGGIEPQVQALDGGQVVGQRSSVTAQSRSVAHDALGIQSYR